MLDGFAIVFSKKIVYLITQCDPCEAAKYSGAAISQGLFIKRMIFFTIKFNNSEKANTQVTNFMAQRTKLFV